MKRILLIEDDHQLARAILLGLDTIKTPPLEKEVQYKGIAGLGRIQWPPAPDLLVLDMHLPDLDGREIYDDIRQKVPGCKIIIITGDVRLASGIRAQLGDWERLVPPDAVFPQALFPRQIPGDGQGVSQPAASLGLIFFNDWGSHSTVFQSQPKGFNAHLGRDGARALQ